MKNVGGTERVLNSAAREVPSLRRCDHVADVRKMLDRLSAADMSMYDTQVLLHRIICAKKPADLAAIVRERATRQDSELSVPGIPAEAARRRFGYRAVM